MALNTVTDLWLMAIPLPASLPSLPQYMNIIAD